MRENSHALQLSSSKVEIRFSFAPTMAATRVCAHCSSRKWLQNSLDYSRAFDFPNPAPHFFFGPFALLLAATT